MRSDTWIIIRDALARCGGEIVAMSILSVALALLAGLTGAGEPGTFMIFLLVLALWPLAIGGLLRGGWGRVVLLIPVERKSTLGVLLLLSTALPALMALVLASILFLFFSTVQEVNWSLLFGWTALQYCTLSGLFVLHAYTTTNYFPGMLTGGSLPTEGWRYLLILWVHGLVLLTLVPLLFRAGNGDPLVSFALFALGVVFSIIGAGRMHSLIIAQRPRSNARNLPITRLRLPARARFSANLSGSLSYSIALIVRNTVIATAIVLAWLLIHFFPEGPDAEFEPRAEWWSLLLAIFGWAMIHPIARALRAIRTVPCSTDRLGSAVVALALGSLLIQVGLLTISIYLIADTETAERCMPLLVGIAGTSSLIIPYILYLGTDSQQSSYPIGLFFIFFPLMWGTQARIWSDWVPWSPIIGAITLAISMLLILRALAKADECLKPANPG